VIPKPDELTADVVFIMEAPDGNLKGVADAESSGTLGAGG